MGDRFYNQVGGDCDWRDAGLPISIVAERH